MGEETAALLKCLFAMTRWPAHVTVVLGLGVLSFAFAPILVRAAGDVPGLAIATWRTITAAVVLWSACAWPRVRRQLRQLSAREWGLIGIAGALLGLHLVCWIESLFHTTVASASIFVTSSPVLLAALGFLVLGERLSWGTLLAMGGAVLGGMLIAWADAGAVTLGRGALWGNSLALTAAAFVSVYLLVGRVVRQSVAWAAYVLPVYTVAAVVVLCMAWGKGVPLLGYSWRFYGLCAALALGPQVVGHGSFNYALQHVSAAVVGMLALLEPVGASVLAYWLFDETPPLLSIGGMGLVMGAVAVVVWRRNQGAERTADAPGAD